MHPLARCSGPWRRGVAAALLWLALALVPPLAARAAGVSISTFYASTSQAYDNWKQTNYAPLPRVDAFPSGTTVLAFYLKYQQANGKTDGYAIVVRRHLGATVNLAAYTLPAGSSSTIVSIPDLAGPHPDGAYDVDLLLDSRLQTTITLTVGAAGGTGNTNAGGAVTIAWFIPITPTQAAAWAHGKQSSSTTRFAAGTTEVDLAFVYKGTTPNVSMEQVIVRGPGGLRLTSGPHGFTDTSGARWEVITQPRHRVFPSGAYIALLLMNGKQVAQAAFTVG